MTRRVSRYMITGVAVLALLSIGYLAFGQQVNKGLHPNLAAAQNFIERAIKRVSDAQQANEFDMGGHAAKAKALLDQAYEEIKLAALAANKG
ncbi:MAG TPA: hypothetical protein VMF68_08195 [Spirochaetia bacterium]|nr:hypothetical protein [Spirochaetia bacterium]